MVGEVIYDIIRTIDDEENILHQGVYLSVREWLESSYHVGGVATSLYPFWKDVVCQVFENPEITEVILTGGLGIGKSFVGMVFWLRVLYELNETKNLHSKFGLADGSWIYLSYLTITLRQAEKTEFGNFRHALDNIPYFAQNMPRNKRKDSELEFPDSRIRIFPGSSASHTIGATLISAMLDEANFFGTRGKLDEGDVEAITRLYANTRQRIRSRFIKEGVDFPGLTILISSVSTQTSFTENTIAENNSNTAVFSGSLWDIKPKGTYKSETFLCFIGSESRNAHVINTPADMQEILGDKFDCLSYDNVFLLYASLSPDKQDLFIKVPIDFQEEFGKDPQGCLANYAGISKSPVGRFFTSRQHFSDNIDVDLHHPFTVDSCTISTDDLMEISNYLKKDFFDNGKVRRHPNARRFLHIDLAESGDAVGISSVCVSEMQGALPIVEYDFMLKVTPPPKPAQIDFSKIRQFIFDLQRMGMDIAHVSFDRFQSTDSIQILNKKGITASILTRSLDKKHWDRFAAAIYQRTLRFYDYPFFRAELFGLISNNKKGTVDHGDKGSSDVVVSACFAYVNAVDHTLEKGRAEDTLASMKAMLKPMIQQKTILGGLVDSDIGFYQNGGRRPISLTSIVSRSLEQR